MYNSLPSPPNTPYKIFFASLRLNLLPPSLSLPLSLTSLHHDLNLNTVLSSCVAMERRMTYVMVSLS